VTHITDAACRAVLLCRAAVARPPGPAAYCCTSRYAATGCCPPRPN